MPLTNSKDMLAQAYIGGYAIGCFNIDSLAMAQAVLEAAEEVRSPVMLALSEGSRAFMHPGNIKDMIELVAKDYHIPYAIHLDHGHSVELCCACIDEGFTSVMIDGSGIDFGANVTLTKEVCAYAHARGASVEAELGPLDAQAGSMSINRYTDPDQVRSFVSLTDVDCLAVSVGTGHGLMKFSQGETPHLRFDILDKIKKELPGFPLVLHGASGVAPEILDKFNRFGGKINQALGVPEQLLIEATKTNVCKINIATDLRMTYIATLRESLANKANRYEPRLFLAPAKEAIKQLVRYKLTHIFNSANRI